jgi:molybdate-binding protein/DNA-binding XRE family transcriptional regulator
MADTGLLCSVREWRRRRDWSQAELAERAGLSRAAIGAIETGRVAPSTAGALALARAFDCRVEDLFGLGGAGAGGTAWAWPPGRATAAPGGRYWLAEVAGRVWRYPAESTALGEQAHDGKGERGEGSAGWGDPAQARRTLVVAGCDPAVGLLAAALRGSGVRLLALVRSSRRALELLGSGRVHVAGVHLGRRRDSNGRVVRNLLGPGFRLVHVARWAEGLALAPGLQLASIRSVVDARLRWVGRDEGSGARSCQDEVLDGRSPEGWDRWAPDHRGVVATIRTGWAQTGVCVRLAAEEAGLDFLPVRWEPYEMCYAEGLESDPRLSALLEVVRSRAYQRLLADLPGYDTRRTGEVT